MKLEFLPEGSPYCPLICLFDFTPSEVSQLGEICRSLASGDRAAVAFHKLAWVKPVGNCRLTFRCEKVDLGVRLPRRTDPLVVALTDSGWCEVVEKLQIFSGGRGSFQWLVNEGDVNFLISKDGQW